MRLFVVDSSARRMWSFASNGSDVAHNWVTGRDELSGQGISLVKGNGAITAIAEKRGGEYLMVDGTQTRAAQNSTTAAKAAAGAVPSRVAEDTALGRTTIAAAVVQKIAGIAAREVPGVYAMGGGVSRAFGALRERIPGGVGTASSSVSGVAVEVGEKQAAVDLDVVVEYGASIVELARAVRRNVIGAVEQMTGLEVIEVNIAVNDIRLPSEDDSADVIVTTSRVE